MSACDSRPGFDHWFSLAVSALALALLTASGRNAQATGFALPQQSATGAGRAQAGDAAAASDPSTVFFNPAGMTRLSTPQLSVGGTLTVLRTRVEDRGSTATTPGTGGNALPYPGNSHGTPADPAMLPNIYLVVPVVEDRLWAGLSVTTPFGLAFDYDDDWFGRYNSIESRLMTVDLGPSLAVKINDYVSLGGGIDIQYADTRLTSALPDPLAPGGPTPETDGRFRVKGDDTSFGYNVGLLLQPAAGTRIGLSYRSKIDHTLRGNARISGLAGPLAAFNTSVGAKADLDLPPTAALAVRQEITERLSLLGELTWYGWSSLDEIRIRFDDPGMADTVRPAKYRDTYAAAVGGEYAMTDRLMLRSGLRYGRTPTRDGFRDTTVPDGDQYWLAAGATWKLTDQIALDAGFAHVIVENANIDVEQTFYDGSPAQSTVRTRGKAKSTTETLSIALRITF
ncbi:MAG: TonB-dependent receptor [Gammaproteobacteria bacterium]|nr:TonB-dependent receptor [Gammaproteobacteria bacterium]